MQFGVEVSVVSAVVLFFAKNMLIQVLTVNCFSFIHTAHRYRFEQSDGL